ncbi:multidrug ABC transporter permease [Cellulomonas hominis]|uniref:ABC-2 type transport system permease protein n=1 Tax=Cellulomonas hominis TaxID=156981 RepID=A0A511F758_9CELL|nr:ABC transporter permease [Cellulomonas hominis]MBB5474132.1 ABC-2 type transport system permease protein [Cellulomonas hominis]GEL45075.1 multidrug ABC transporter permease [Cellulomonas hominis]
MTAVGQTLLLAQWQFRRQSTYLPLMVVVQVFMAVATVVGYGLLVGDPDPVTALYLATGAPTVTLITVGLVMTPQMQSQSRIEGSLDWMRTLPVPRTLFLISDLLIWTLLALPGMVLGVVAGVLRFDIDLSLAPWLVPGALLVSLTAAAVGYAMASLLAPALAMLLTQALVFVVLLFSPVSYPAERMPGWLQAAHEWLPIEPMAQLVRSGLASDAFSMPARSLVVLLVWCVASVVGATWALRRRA